MDSGNGIFTYRHGISVAQIVVFSFFLYVSRHFKLSNRSGWSTISIFSIFRIVGGSCLLALINDDSDGLLITAFVCESQGVLLVLFLLVEILQDINGQINCLHPWLFHSPAVIAAAEFGVAIGGFVEMSKQESLFRPNRFTIAAAALVVLNHLCVLSLAATVWRHREKVPKVYKPGLGCVFAGALPLMMRIVYTLIYNITADMMWNCIKGNATLYLCLSALPEIAVVAICSWTILKLPPKEEKDGKIADVEGRKHEEYFPLGQVPDGGRQRS